MQHIVHTWASRILIVSLLTAGAASADTIRLKNGRTIYADRTREVDGKIEYEVGDNTFAIPKASVERIEAGGMPGPRSSTSSAADPDLPAIEPTGTVKHADAVRLKVVKDGHVDLDALAAADQHPDPEFTAAAYFVAGRFEQTHGNPDRASVYLQRAMGLMPGNPVIVEQYASLLLDMNRFAEAVPYALEATRLAPNSADAHALLGYAYFHSEKTKEAIAEFKRSLEIKPDPMVEKLLAKAQREASAEASFGEQESGHFTMRYEGGKAPAALRAAIMQTLERHYDDLVREFGISPRQNISVSLYTEQAYFDVTRAPAWSAAQNDGKLRIPIEGLNGVNSELSRVLKHELAHSFIAQITRNRCPNWLNEGIAQVVEPATAAPFGAPLGRMFAHEAEIPLNMLEGSFGAFDDRTAMVAYGESLAAVEYIVQTYGMSDVVRLLQRIGEGSSAESALRAVVHSGYASFQTDIGNYLKKTYGE
ncbi:MAG TPA: tetratricopeptide repeat protein [Terriglobales bacterium]|nr:tetratricopeptide repeat protein [Terriglobales bacterium]